MTKKRLPCIASSNSFSLLPAKFQRVLDGTTIPATLVPLHFPVLE